MMILPIRNLTAMNNLKFWNNYNFFEEEEEKHFEKNNYYNFLLRCC